MNPLLALLKTGLNFTSHQRGAQAIVLCNKTSITSFILAITFFLFYFVFFPWDIITTLTLLFSFLFLIPILFNRIGLVTLSRIWVCAYLPTIALIASIISKIILRPIVQDSEYYEFRFFILAASAFPVILFDTSEKKIMILCILYTFICLLSFDVLHNVFNVGYYQTGQRDYTYYFTNVVIAITFITITISLFIVKITLEKNELTTEQLIQELSEANKDLVDKNTEIEAQHQEILTQDKVLNSSQYKLLEAYKVIENQKELLSKENRNLEIEIIEKNKNLTETNAELIKHNNELRQFSYTVSHNLRGPVASLLGLLALINVKKLPTSEADVFRHIISSARLLDTIITDLGKIIDIRHNIFQIKQKIQLKEELNKVKALLRKEIEAHSVSITADIENCQQLYSVKPMVHSILYNLISNSIKYRSLDRTPEINLICSENEHYYIIRIKDNGLGINLKDHQNNLFKLYKRFHYHTEGKGLGLYLVKLQCEILGGFIDVESEMNKYTAFTVYLKKPENVNRQLLYNETYSQIFFDALINCMGVVWFAPTDEQYRETFSRCLEFLKIYNTPNWISDLSHQGFIKDESQQWMINSILPQAIENGLKRIAIVKSNSSTETRSQYIENIEKISQHLKLHLRFFITFEDAVNWIQEENEKSIITNATR